VIRGCLVSEVAQQCRSLLTGISLQVGLLLATLVTTDIAAYYLMPDAIAANFPTYREGYYVPEFMGRGYPKGYYVSNPERGFDIKQTELPATDLVHDLDDVGLVYNIWANRYGCFDTPHEEPKPGYYYFAGDSITWGYAPFDSKFGTVFEVERGIETFKCGVTHTGQLHQFSKFKEVARNVGFWPSKVAVFYSPSDVANDYLHPHSSVIDGGLADTVRLDEHNHPYKLDEGWYSSVRERMDEERHLYAGDTFSLSKWLMQYSISAQFVNAALYVARNNIPGVDNIIPMLGAEPFLHWADKYETYKGNKLYDLHRIVYLETRDGVFAYTDFPYAQRNKDALRQWSLHASLNKYELIIVLLPIVEIVDMKPRPVGSDPYRELKAYFDKINLEYVDLDTELRKTGTIPKDLFWESNSHLSIDGNIVVGELLADLL
jgi:hypothetical protein